MHHTQARTVACLLAQRASSPKAAAASRSRPQIRATQELCALSPDGRPTAGGHPRSWKAGAVRSPLCLAHDLVGEEGEAVTDGPGVEEAHALLVAGLLEEALAGPERDWVDHQP